MSVNFRPPVAESPAIGWAQVLGLRQDDAVLFGRVRAAQLQSLNRYVPFNVSLMVINITALVYTLRDLAGGDFLLRWGGMMAVLALLWSLRFVRVRRNGPAPVASPRLFWLVTLEVLAFGVCWTSLVLHLMPLAGVEAQAVLMLLSLTAMGACGLAAAAMPVCGAGLVAIIGIGTLLAVPAGSPLGSPMIALAFLTFSLLIGRGVVVTSKALMVQMRDAAGTQAHADMVRMLLDEFEANGSDWLIEVDDEGRLTHVSPRFAAVAGQPRADLLGRPLLGLIGEASGADRAAVTALTDSFVARRGFRDITIPVQVGGDRRWWALSGTPKLDAAGGFAGYRGVGRDVTEARRSHERIVHLARFDPLTGLANRALFREALTDALARAARTGRSCGLLFIDLDHFKAVNDSQGHAAGDRLLREAAVRMGGAVGGNATLARLGGDEFAVLLPDASAARVERVAGAIIAAMTPPFDIDGQPVNIGASIGYAIGPGDGATIDKLLKSADLALYEVKSNGRGATCRYVPEIRERADERRELETDMAKALDRDELALAFQPVVEAVDEQIVGFEALLRWKHPRLGNIPPDKFIPVAEETGAIVPIGHWVIRTACAWAARWPEHIRIA
ncbi:MAG: putative bifunctional diguanylate cyclase/phosphodiesterase, partial [Polymorphobacter sp.]